MRRRRENRPGDGSSESAVSSGQSQRRNCRPFEAFFTGTPRNIISTTSFEQINSAIFPPNTRTKTYSKDIVGLIIRGEKTRLFRSPHHVRKNSIPKYLRIRKHLFIDSPLVALRKFESRFPSGRYGFGEFAGSAPKFFASGKEVCTPVSKCLAGGYGEGRTREATTGGQVKISGCLFPCEDIWPVRASSK